jgi:hypothetical protein
MSAIKISRWICEDADCCFLATESIACGNERLICTSMLMESEFPDIADTVPSDCPFLVEHVLSESSEVNQENIK